jgi:hypothetical protein
VHASGKSPTSRQRHASVGVAIPAKMWLGKRPKLIGSGMSLQPPGSAGALAGPSPHSRHRHTAGTSPVHPLHTGNFVSTEMFAVRQWTRWPSGTGWSSRGIPARQRPSQVRQQACEAAPGAVSDLTLGQFSITPKTLADGVAERCRRLTSLRAPHPPAPRWPDG